MHDDVARVERRAARFVTERLRPAVYRRQQPLTAVSWDAPGEPVDFGTAYAATYAPCAPGQAWGRPWGTTWFRLTGEVPADWAAAEDLTAEIVVDLGFGGQPGFSAEATAYAADGTIIKGLHPRNRHLPVAGRPGRRLRGGLGQPGRRAGELPAHPAGRSRDRGNRAAVPVSRRVAGRARHGRLGADPGRRRVDRSDARAAVRLAPAGQGAAGPGRPGRRGRAA